MLSIGQVDQEPSANRRLIDTSFYGQLAWNNHASRCFARASSGRVTRGLHIQPLMCVPYGARVLFSVIF